MKNAYEDCHVCGRSWLRCSGDCVSWLWYSGSGSGEKDHPNVIYRAARDPEQTASDIFEKEHSSLDYIEEDVIYLKRSTDTKWLKYNVRIEMEPAFYADEADEDDDE